MAGKVGPLGQNLRRLRERRGLTQEELGSRGGLNREAVAKVETGANPNPSLKTLEAFAAALEVTVAELVASPEAQREAEARAELARQQHHQELRQLVATALSLARAAGLTTRELGLEPPPDPATLPGPEAAAVLAAFKASPWWRATSPSPEERAWLESLPDGFWAALRPSPETVHHLVNGYRKRRPAPAPEAKPAS